MNEGSTATSSNRIRITLTISVVSTDFDAQMSSIRVNGKVVVENENVKMGAHHCIEIEVRI